MSAKVCVSWVLVCAVLMSGCSTSATISMADGAEHEVTIYDGDKDYVYGYIEEEVEGQPEPVKAYKRFSRGEIKDIDHPGDVQMVVGGSIFALGAASTIVLLVSMPELREVDEDNVFDSPYWTMFDHLGWLLAVTSAGSVMVGGGGIFLDGSERWSGSRDAAEPYIGLQLAPMVTRDERGDAVVGVGLGLTW